MTQTPLRAVLFDVGGVLVTQRMDARHVTEILGLDVANPFEVSAVDHAIWSHRDSHDEGISDAEFWTAITLDLGVGEPQPHMLEELVRQDIERMHNVDNEALALVKDLRQAGYIMGILANSPVSVARELESTAWARDNFDLFVFSGDYHQRKPKSRIYQIACDELKLDVEEILFIDDRPQHVRTAQYLGMQGLVWESPAQSITELRQRRII